MGIDVHALNFLRYAKQFGAFGRVLTIGRQNSLQLDGIAAYDPMALS